MIELNLSEIKKVKASARDLDQGWASLRLTFMTPANEENIEIVAFIPSLETAQQYADAINTCNDREAVDADPRHHTYE